MNERKLLQFLQLRARLYRIGMWTLVAICVIMAAVAVIRVL